jgi:hypothetical protein
MMRPFSVIWVVVVCVALVGCGATSEGRDSGAGGGDGGVGDSDGGIGDSDGGRDASSPGDLGVCATMPVSFKSDIASGIFATSCGGESAYGNLVGVLANNPGASARNKLRVVPGDADASFLWQKLTNALANDEGSPMPEGPGYPLANAKLEAIRCWIVTGAQDN